MEKVLLEKQVHQIPVVKLLLALLEMVYPVTARVPQFRWQIASDRLLIYVTPQSSGPYEAAHILLQATWFRHELKAMRRELLVCAFLVNPEQVPSLFSRINKEFAKGQM